jgi:hypothetical protein
MQKFKPWRTVDCVVGGIYHKAGIKAVEYLLMGSYDDAGRLNYVGRCDVGENKEEIGRLLMPLIGSAGFTGNAPGGKPLVVGARARAGALATSVGSGDQRESHRERPAPLWHQTGPIARRQGAEGLHDGSDHLIVVRAEPITHANDRYAPV